MRKVKFDFSLILWYNIYRIEGVYIMEIEAFFINQKEFQTLIINNIMSGEYKKYIANSTYADSKEFDIGFMLGMNWAALLTSQCNLYEDYINKIEETENVSNND